MPIDGISASDIQDAAELREMILIEEPDHSGPHAPLLVPINASPDHSTDDASEASYSVGWFIWILTFSAGISGLLFGYEYVTTHLFSYAAILADHPVNSQYRCNILYPRDHWLRSL